MSSSGMEEEFDVLWHQPLVVFDFEEIVLYY